MTTRRDPTAGRDDPLGRSLEEAYAQVRACYVLEYRDFLDRHRGVRNSDYGRTAIPRWDGGRDPNTGTRYRPVWPLLARFALRNGVSPTDLIRATFAAWPSVERPPFPNQILSERALAACRKYRQGRLGLLLSLTRSAMERIQARAAAARRADPSLSRLESARRALAGERALSPLVLLVVAREHGDWDLMGRHLHLAAVEYLGAPEAWEEVLGDHLPEDLKEYAREYVLPALAGPADRPGDQDSG